MWTCDLAAEALAELPVRPAPAFAFAPAQLICRAALAVTTAPKPSNRAMPNGIHISIFIYGASYTNLLAEILLANLAALVLEIPRTCGD
jgi:hypothetical protein